MLTIEEIRKIKQHTALPPNNTAINEMLVKPTIATPIIKIDILVNVSAAGLDIFDNEDVVILGCPAMGDEVLEEGEFEPFIEGISSKISGKKVALFGSYGWGDGQWMRDWQERMESLGCTLIDDGLIINYEPEDESPECINFGLKIAKVQYKI